MNLIFIYGPPATGKLTVAKELAKLIGYKLLHNHLTADLVSSLFPFGTKIYSQLAGKIRLDLIEAAAKSAIPGVIITFVYGVETFGGKSDDQFVKQIIDTVEKHHGRVLFVKLTCQEPALRERLNNPSRKRYNKLVDYKVLESIREKFDLDAIIPFGKTQVIDNTKLSAKKVAEHIQRYYKLTR